MLKEKLRCNVKIWRLVQTCATKRERKGQPVPARGSKQARRLEPRRRGDHNKRGAKGEGHPLPPQRDAGLRLPGTKSHGGCDKLRTYRPEVMSFGSSAGRIDGFGTSTGRIDGFRHQPESDGYGSSAGKVIVTGYQSKGAIAGDSYWISAERVMVSEHQPKDRWFQNISQKVMVTDHQLER